MRCENCGNDDTILLAHNAAIGTHHWGDGEERDCTCDPKTICAFCDAALISQHGFLVLDSMFFGPTNDTLQ